MRNFCLSSNIIVIYQIIHEDSLTFIEQEPPIG